MEEGDGCEGALGWYPQLVPDLEFRNKVDSCVLGYFHLEVKR